MRWFEKQRIEWLQLRFQMHGIVNRSDLVKRYSISVPQASKDIATYKRLVKKWKMPQITYNKTERRYEAAWYTRMCAEQTP